MQVKKQQRTEEVAQTRKAAGEIVEFLRAGLLASFGPGVGWRVRARCMVL